MKVLQIELPRAEREARNVQRGQVVSPVDPKATDLHEGFWIKVTRGMLAKDGECRFARLDNGLLVDVPNTTLVHVYPDARYATGPAARG